jgi:predicted ATP-grasp superfamily ATP-dependent carboligase
MKILVFEYICGGGFCSEILPDALAKEGLLMLTALLRDLTIIEEHSITVLADWRFLNNFENGIEIIPIEKETDILATFKSTLYFIDAVWLIAPETEQILFNLSQIVESSNKILLSSPSLTIAQTADKWQSYQCLSSYHIPTVNTAILTNNTQINAQQTVVKARDSVGCENSFIVDSQEELISLLAQFEQPNNYIIQPFIKGENLSISALFKLGKAQLLCVNRQQIQIIDQQFKLLGCEVNYQIKLAVFQRLVNQIAIAFPKLWGYVGIDLIQQSQQLLVLEINPRLTSSYAGINAVLGINVAAEVLKLLEFKLREIPQSNHSVWVNLS